MPPATTISSSLRALGRPGEQNVFGLTPAACAARYSPSDAISTPAPSSQNQWLGAHPGNSRELIADRHAGQCLRLCSRDERQEGQGWDHPRLKAEEMHFMIVNNREGGQSTQIGNRVNADRRKPTLLMHGCN